MGDLSPVSLRKDTILQNQHNFKPLLGIFTIFVNYDYFYVNIIMSTLATNPKFSFTIFNYFPRYGDAYRILALNIVFARNPAYKN